MSPADDLPLRLIPADVIPPEPNRSLTGSTFDWIPELGGYAWVAYGASSLLVVSHLPSPLSDHESTVGPIFRQVFQLPSRVSAVSCCCLDGRVAAASGNCVFIYSLESARSFGSFCWSQNAVLPQSTEVDVVAWTSSGDGLIAGGVEVVLWKNEKSSWEIAWKYRERLPQTLVSATWSLEGPAATAAHPVEPRDEEASTRDDSRSVIVCKFIKEFGYMKTELCHPHPVFMIQWRPLTRRRLKKNSKIRDVLLTCCMDGAVRLWTEIDLGRVKKNEKESVDLKLRTFKFCVVAVIEKSSYPSATLNQRLFVRWATEVGQSCQFSEEDCRLFPTEFSENDKNWECEWLVGFGPSSEVTFWAIHCLDEFSLLRYPRLVKWKSKELQDVGNFVKLTLDQPSIGSKVIISRKNSSMPPSSCSFIHFSTCNSIVRFLLYDRELSSSSRDLSVSLSPATSFLSTDAARFLSVDGHYGKILQVVLHPYACDTGLAMSLDSNGLLLFWLFSTVSNYMPCRPTLNPAWKLYGKLVIPNGSSKHTSLAWVPLEMDDDQMVFLGHLRGIDCFIVNISSSDRNFTWHKLCTIPLFDRGLLEEGPTKIFSVPLSSSSSKSFKFIKFILLAAWMKVFHVLGWEISLQSHDFSGSYFERNVDIDFTSQSNMLKFEHTFGGKRYQLFVSPSLSKFPEPHCHDQVTSFCVVRPSMSFSFSQNEKNSVEESQNKQPAYIMATGCSNGNLKLWNSRKASDGLYLWELVGMVAHQSPISKLSLSDFGHYIAVLQGASNLGSGNSLRVWSAVNIIAGGCLLSEDTIDLDGDVVAMNWLALGDGHQILGVCLSDKLLVYTCKRYGGHYLLRSGEPASAHAWVCIAYAHISSPVSNFFWGPCLTAIVVHGEFICLFSQWLSPGKSGKAGKDNPFGCRKGPIKDFSATNNGSLCTSTTAEVLYMSNEHSASGLFPENVYAESDLHICITSSSILEVNESLCGSLPVYHPEALLFSIYSGRWRRARLALRHLVAYISSCRKGDTSQKCFNDIPQVILSSYLEGDEISSSKIFDWSSSADSNLDMASWEKEKREADTSSHCFASQPFQAGLNSIISSLDSSHWGNTFSEKEKIEILAIIDLLGEISDSHSASVYESLDDPGRRFWIAVRYRQLHFQRKFAKVAAVEELFVDSASICWAFQSECQDNLLDAFLPKESTWQELRAMGFGLWFNDITKFRPKMEKMARLRYLKRKDPKDCALLYIALNRVQVLAGLFKLSKNEKDKLLVGFLSRNFQEDKNKAAALKNAYVLLGRHQLELAISFFLLGGDSSSAITVCAKNLGDEQLALVICRLVEGGGGPLEHNLITKIMLPTALEKGDYWLASLLEWQLGNYAKSFLSLLSSQNNSIKRLALSDNFPPFLDPSIGLYCLFMAAKNNMKNSVGGHSAAIFGRWATVITATALKKMGLPLEALEYLSSNVWREFDNQMVLDSGNSDIINIILVATGCSSPDWLAGDIAVQLESHVKYDLACQHFVKLMREHPSWPCSNGRSGTFCLYCKHATPKDEKPLTMFLGKLHADLMLVEQKFSLDAAFLFRMIAVFLYNRGSFFIAYGVLRCLKWQQDSQNQTDAIDKLALCLEKQTYKAAVEVSLLFSRFIATCGVICLQLTSHCSENWELDVLPRSCRSLYGGNQLLNAVHSLENLRAALRIYYDLCEEDWRNKCFLLMDLLEYLVHFAFVWRLKDSKALLLILQPLLVSLSNGHPPYNVDMADLKTVIYLIDEIMPCSSTNDDVGFSPHMSGNREEHGRKKGAHMIPDDERTGILALSLWQHLSRFVNHKLRMILELANGSHFPGSEQGQLPLFASGSSQSKSDRADISNQMGLLVSCLSHSVKNSLLHASSYHVKQLAFLIREKMDNGFQASTFVWLEESKQAEPRALLEQSSVDNTLEVLKNNHESSIYEILWNSWADPFIISESLMLRKINWSKYANMKQFTGWREVHEGSSREENLSKKDYEGGNRVGSPIMNGSPSRTFFSTGNSLLNTWHKEATVVKEIIHFHSPKDILKRNGELLEALCINSTDERKIAVSSNRKGIIFSSMGDGFPCYQRNYKMSETEWPPHNWADSDATGVSTCVSPSIGNESKRGAHLRVGRETAVVSPVSAYGSDLTEGGADGIPGSAGIGTSISGWQVLEDEEFVEQRATVDNIRSRALSSHPSMPYFLVGSSNTHIYLWEFNKQKAVVTYGVLPTANVPPPYALASISALKFDPCGHRFATAALDGTICTWQLEVGGRSYSYPTESSLCFNGHASDVTYVTSSGSVVAACGYSSNDMNVVIWDMLAPPSTSQASISCHEGGARSIAVLNGYSGGSSVSPVILTGGKGGDVGLHDFRYIATGKTRRHIISDNGEPSNREISAMNESTGMGTKSGLENVGGMLWYLPKAHLGSVTKISPIPETSLFLTGSKDGDVKLWDAKTARLLNHWPKLHERHTFLQPSTRGFGGVVRAGVTDIQVISHGFVTCGGDGSIKLVQLGDYT